MSFVLKSGSNVGFIDAADARKPQPKILNMDCDLEVLALPWEDEKLRDPVSRPKNEEFLVGIDSVGALVVRFAVAPLLLFLRLEEEKDRLPFKAFVFC
jgi:hypothetical protein